MTMPNRMRVRRICQTIFATGLAIAGVVVWVRAALSAVAPPPVDGAAIRVIVGAALAMAGFGLGLYAVHAPEPKQW